MNEAIVAYARECIGTPYLHQGRMIGVGLDCGGVLSHVLNRMGVSYVDNIGYSMTPSNGLMESMLNIQPFLTLVSDMQAGDIFLMRFATEPQHVAIYTGENIIHSYSTVKQVCEHRLDDAWRRRVVAIYRFKGDQS